MYSLVPNKFIQVAVAEPQKSSSHQSLVTIYSLIPLTSLVCFRNQVLVYVITFQIGGVPCVQLDETNVKNRDNI
jgi:hypothetical protein